MKVSNWGRYPEVEADVKLLNPLKVAAQIDGAKDFIVRGLGRSYGDASLSANIYSALHLNHYLAFSAETGRLHAQAGVSFKDIIDTFLPKGWFLPVTPGTKYITLGGAIAANVHGKNHHSEGSFFRHVESITLLTAEGKLLECSRKQHPKLFEATFGGMGLTGIILSAVFKLKKVTSAYIRQQTLKASNLADVFALFERTQSYTYSVAWIDCLAKGKNLGRSVLMLGEHAEKTEVKTTKPLNYQEKSLFTLPIDFPTWLLNPLSIGAFNQVFYHKHINGAEDIIPLEPYFYPLDKIKHWNRMYGKRGFLQYQFVLPLQNSYEGMQELLSIINQQQNPSFLAVLKLFGKKDAGYLSFPQEGYTLALDFPYSKEILSVLTKLDEIVQKYEGRVYLAKDARMHPYFFRAGYPELEAFEAIKREYDPHLKLQSDLSKRLKMFT